MSFSILSSNLNYGFTLLKDCGDYLLNYGSDLLKKCDFTQLSLYLKEISLVDLTNSLYDYVPNLLSRVFNFSLEHYYISGISLIVLMEIIWKMIPLTKSQQEKRILKQIEKLKNQKLKPIKKQWSKDKKPFIFLVNQIKKECEKLKNNFIKTSKLKYEDLSKIVKQMEELENKLIPLRIKYPMIINLSIFHKKIQEIQQELFAFVINIKSNPIIDARKVENVVRLSYEFEQYYKNSKKLSLV